MTEYASYADYFDRGPQRGFVDRNRLCGTGEIALTHVSNNPPGEHCSPQVPEFLLMIFGPGSYSMRYDIGQGWRYGRFRQGDLLLAPPSVRNEYHTETVTNFTTIALPISFIRPWLRDSEYAGSFDFGALHEGCFRDPTIARHALRMIWEAGTEAPPDALQTDQTAVTLLELLAKKAQRVSARRRRDIPLDQLTLRRIVDYIDYNLQDEITLADLASIAHCSVPHFARAFKVTVGKPPYAYVLAHRIHRAKEMLLNTDQPIADIALECGFSSQAHLTSLFSRFTGTSPAQYRRESGHKLIT